MEISEIYEATNKGLDIIHFYYPDARPGKPFKIRNERTPSTHIKCVGDTYLLNDFGNNTKPLNPIGLVMENESLDFAEALKFINKNILNGYVKEKPQNYESLPSDYKEEKSKFTFNKKAKFSKTELQILGPYVTNEVVKKYKLFSLNSYHVDKAGKTHIFKSTPENPIFLYDYGDWQKIYKPLDPDKARRFFYIGSRPANYIFGLEQIEIPTSDRIILCSGERDLLNLASLGETAVCLNSETASFTYSQFKQLREKATDLYILPDIDETGLKAGFDIAKNFISMKVIVLPDTLKTFKDSRGKACKDFTDYLKHFKKEDFYGLLEKTKNLQFFDPIYTKDKDGNYQLKEYKFKYKRAFEFLTSWGFHLYRNPNKKTGYDIIRIQDNKIETVEPYEVKKFIIDWLEERNFNEDLLELFYKGGDQYLNEKKLENLYFMDPEFEQAGKDYQYMFYSNCVVKITKKGIETIPYSQFDKPIWTDKIRDRPFKKLPPFFNITKSKGEYNLKINNTKCDFWQYIIDTSNIYWRIDKEKRTEEQRQEIMQHTKNKIYANGYLLHTHKDESKPWAVFSMDSKESTIGESYGGSGKSILGNAIRNLLSTHVLDGRDLKLTDKPHIFQGITKETDFIFVDDCHIRLKFSWFFAKITGDLPVNPKGTAQFNIPFSESPKFYFASNHALDEQDSSTMRRILYIVFSDYYHPKDQDYKEERTPFTKFGKNFFSADWSPDDWNAFDNFMLQCIQAYLFMNEKQGPPIKNVEKRNLRQIMGEPFFDWASVYYSDPVHLNVEENRINVVGDFETFTSPSDRRNWSAQQFKKALKAFCKYRGFEFNRASNGERITRNGVEYLEVSEKQ